MKFIITIDIKEDHKVPEILKQLAQKLDDHKSANLMDAGNVLVIRSDGTACGTFKVEESEG